MKCPICKRGVLNEFTAGVYCSRRYAKRAPCDFVAGLADSPTHWRAQVSRYRAKLAERSPRRVNSPS